MVYKDDLKAAHSRIHALEMENNQLRKAKPLKEKKMKCKTCGGWFHRTGAAVAKAVVGTIVLAGVAAGAYPLYMTVFNSKAEGCYIEYDTRGNRHVLNQTIAWGTDRTMGEYRTVQEALDEAKILKCFLEKDARIEE